MKDHGEENKTLVEARELSLKANCIKKIQQSVHKKMDYSRGISKHLKGVETMNNNDKLSELLNTTKQSNFIPPKMNPLPTVDRSIFDMSHLDDAMEEIALEKEEEESREREYRESVIKALQGIEKNTAVLAEMTSLLQKNNEKQDEIFNLMVEILAIMKSSNQEEAASKYTEVMKKITTFTDNANTIQSLVNMTQTVFNAYQSMPF